MNWFLLPGDRMCDLVGLRDPEGRIVLRLFFNMLVWGVVVVLVAALIL